MKRIGNVLMLTLSLLGLALVLGVAMSHSVRAAVSTLVTVSNTTANPAATLDADRATRIPYSSTSFSPFGTGQCFSGNCNFFFSAAPAGYRLVVENVNAYLSVTGTHAPVGYLVAGAESFRGVSGIANANDGAIINQPIVAYFEPSDGTPQFTVFADFGAAASAGQYATLTGYLIDCSVASCPPIQH